MRELFAGTGVELEFERDSVESQREFDTPDDAVEFFTSKFDPLMNARAGAEAEGRWPELREQLLAFFESDEPAEYLVTLGRKT